MAAEASWYRQDDGRLRYWDGRSWTAHFSEPGALSPGRYRKPDGSLVSWDGDAWSDGIQVHPRGSRATGGAASPAGASGRRSRPTRVWRGRTGKYHRVCDCPSLADWSSSSLHEVRLDETKDLSGPCLICWDGSPEMSGWRRVAHDTERTGDSPFEVRFVEEVLCHVDGLAPKMVEPQVRVRTRDGRQLRVDFMVHLPGDRQLAIELDGYDKDPLRSSPQVIQERSAQRRRQLEVIVDDVIAFTNADLGNPRAAIRDLENRLRTHEGLAVSTRVATEGEPGSPNSSARQDRNRSHAGSWGFLWLLASSRVGFGL